MGDSGAITVEVVVEEDKAAVVDIIIMAVDITSFTPTERFATSLWPQVLIVRVHGFYFCVWWLP